SLAAKEETTQPKSEQPPGKSETSKAVSGGILNDKAISLPEPTYPAMAKAIRAAGTVVVEVTLNEEGRVISARATSGHALLHAAAVEAAHKAIFPQTILSGVPVKVIGIINY